MKPNLRFRAEGDKSTLHGLVAALVEDCPTETKIRAAMADAVARHVAMASGWLLTDTLSAEEIDRAAAVLTSGEDP